jgi:hypothetical protein
VKSADAKGEALRKTQTSFFLPAPPDVIYCNAPSRDVEQLTKDERKGAASAAVPEYTPFHIQHHPWSAQSPTVTSRMPAIVLPELISLILALLLL